MLKELVVDEGPFQTSGLNRLLEVYRDEQEWEQGLGVLELLSGSRFGKTYEEWAPTRAHFCCELAERAINLKDYDSARRWLKQALNYDRHSVRASLLLGRLEITAGNSQRGVQQLQKIADQNPDYLSEALPYLLEGYSKLNNLKKYLAFLMESYKKYSSPILVSALTDVIALEKGDRAAVEFIAREVRDHPSGIGLHKLLDYYLSFSRGTTQEHLGALQVVMRRVISQSPHYQCQKCGFRGQELHWLCPSCKQWGVIKPVKNVGEEV